MIIKYTSDNKEQIESLLRDEDHLIEGKGYEDYIIKVRDEHNKLRLGDYLLVTNGNNYVTPKEVHERLYEKENI